MGLFNWFSSKKNISDDNTSGSERLEEKQELVTGEKEIVIPKSLPEAVKMIAEERGSNFLCERAFINMLNDYNLLKDIPALKNVFRNMQDEGYIGKMISFTNWELESRSLCAQYIKDFGAKESIVAYIVSCVGYGLNKVDMLPIYAESNEVKEDENNTFNDPATQTVRIDLEPEPEKTKTDAIPINPTISEPYDPKKDLPNYIYPGLLLLNNDADISVVSLRSIFDTEAFCNTSFDLPCAIGKKENGSILMFDLTSAPHILLSGASGMGVSVFFNTIATSLLFKKHPAELKMVFIDPKKIEFSLYSPLKNYFLAAPFDQDPILSDMSKVPVLLRSLCKEMDTRYNLLKEAGTRNIRDYNKKFCYRNLSPAKGHRYMPYIVVFIDEYDEIIRCTGNVIEEHLDRLVRLSRAVGIHLIISVQRPVGTVISNDIKSNITTRISFRVTSSSDSRNILGLSGAEKLRLPGEMLFYNGAELIKARCAFTDMEEIDRINRHIEGQEGYSYEFELPDPDLSTFVDIDNDVDMRHLDPLFDDAARLIVFNQSGSTALIQRKFAIGYNRAGRLMDQLEKAGIVGPAKGSTPRAVLIQDEMRLNKLLNALR